MKSTVMLVITVASFWKLAVIYKKIKKIVPALGFELGCVKANFLFLFDLLERLIIYKIKPKKLGRLGLEHGSQGLYCAVLTVEPVGVFWKKGKRYAT